ncbi:MAG: hypothetical protein NT124_00665 [Candidatus Dependentiae bacterium]|nr:hypothetical protein [Candidatus Dependentiae bacterium]
MKNKKLLLMVALSCAAGHGLHTFAAAQAAEKYSTQRLKDAYETCDIKEATRILASKDLSVEDVQQLFNDIEDENTPNIDDSEGEEALEMETIQIKVTKGDIEHLMLQYLLQNAPQAAGEEADEKFTLVRSDGPAENGPARSEFQMQLEHRGLSIAETIIHNNGRVPAQTEENLRAIIWSLFAIAAQKGQSFDEGTFVIEDQNNYLYRWLATFPGAKQRLATHFQEYPGITYYGLNIKNLPHNHTTLLCGSFTHNANNKQYVFIKPELHGVEEWGEWASHGVGLFQSKARKHIPGAQALFGSDDQEGWRKERVPSAISNLFGTIIKLANKGWAHSWLSPASHHKNNPATLIKNGKTGGIWKMREIVHAIDEKTIPAQKKAEFKDLKTRFEAECKKYDHLDIRKGREVILTPKDFQVSPYVAASEAEEKEEKE